MATRGRSVRLSLLFQFVIWGNASALVAAPPIFATSPVRIPETMQRVTALEFSPDGRFLLSGHGSHERSGAIQIWEVFSGKRVALHVLPIGVSSVGWLPTGERFAFSVWDNSVRVLEFPSLKQVSELKIDRSVGYLAVAPEGKQLVTVAEGLRDNDESPGRTVQIWDAETGELVRTCDSEERMFRLGCTAWSPQGRYLAGGGGFYGRQVGLGRLWFADTGKEASRLEGHTGFIRAIRFFPNDLQVATSGLDGTVRIWESATGKQVARFFVGSLVNGLDVSVDGTLLASGGAGGEIALWSPESEQKVVDLNKSGAAVNCVALSRDGKLLASGLADGIAQIWDVAEQKLKRELPLAGSEDRLGVPLAIGSLAEGQVAVVGYDTGSLIATDVERRSRTWRYDAGKSKSPTTVAVAADQKRLLVGYEDGAVRLHAAADGSVQLELKQLPARVSAVACDANTGRLAAGDIEGRLWLWEQSGELRREGWQEHRGPVLAIAFGKKGGTLVSVGSDGKAVCREINSDKVLAENQLSKTPPVSASISQDGSTAVILGQQLTVWDALTLTRRSEMPIRANSRNTASVSPDGALVIVSHPLGTSMFDVNHDGPIELVRTTNSREGGLLALSTDRSTLLQATTSGTLLAWHAQPLQIAPLGHIPRAGNAVALATSPDGKWLVSGGDDSQATVWDLATGKIVEILPGNLGTMYAIQFSDDSSLLATANLTGTVKVWKVKDWSLEGILLNPQRQVRCVAFSPNGRWLASGGNDRKLLITDTQSWETVAEQPDQDLWVEGVAFSPDGKRLYSVTGSWDLKDQPVKSTLSAWRVTADDTKVMLEPLKKITAHEGTTDNLVVTPDGRLVITGGSDGFLNVWDATTLARVRSIKLSAGAHRLRLLRSDPALVVVGDHLGGVSTWNVQKGRCLANFAGHTSHVFDVSATPDGRLLVGASEDDRLLFWPGPTRGPDAALTKFLQTATQTVGKER